jgi:hypothetical protein
VSGDRRELRCTLRNQLLGCWPPILYTPPKNNCVLAGYDEKFKGKVTGIRTIKTTKSSKKYATIKYEDGDVEDITRKELLEIVEAPGAAKKRAGTGGAGTLAAARGSSRAGPAPLRSASGKRKATATAEEEDDLPGIMDGIAAHSKQVVRPTQLSLRSRHACAPQRTAAPLLNPTLTAVCRPPAWCGCRTRSPSKLHPLALWPAARCSLSQTSAPWSKGCRRIPRRSPRTRTTWPRRARRWRSWTLLCARLAAGGGCW